MTDTPTQPDEIEYYEDGDDDYASRNNNPNQKTNTNQINPIHTSNALAEMQQHMAEEIKLQKLEQQQIQKRNIKSSQKHSHTHSENNTPQITYSYNDIVTLKDGREGKIKFIGTLGFGSDTWCGLILSTPTGSHNGIVKNRTYWNCKPNHGTFVKRNHISCIKLQRIGERFTIHEKVKTPKGKGYIRFIGIINDTNSIEEYHEDREKDIHDSEQVMYGIELMDQMGSNSGSINNKYYFSCAHYRGMLYTEKDLIWVAPDAPPTPRISRKRRKKTTKGKTVKKKVNDEEEIIGLDENDESIALEGFDVNNDSDSITDSSDDEFLSNDDVKRLSLVSNKIDDRMSFARILSDFKTVQKDKVRNMAQNWEKKITSDTNNKQRFSQSHTKSEKSEVELAQELINESRKRAGTSPNKSTIAASPIYQPPKFADSIIYRSKQYKNRQVRRDKTNELMNKVKNGYGHGAQSTPVSPNYKPPPGNPILHTSSSSQSASVSSFSKPRPKYRGKKKKKKVVQFDQIGSSVDMMSPDSIDDYGIHSQKSPSPMTLSPAQSNNNLHNNNSIREEVDIEQKEPIHSATKSRDSIDDMEGDNNTQSVSMPFSKLGKDGNRPKRTSSVPVSKVSNINTNNTMGYHSPGIISPGGGMPSLTLQNSHSLDLEQQDSVAVVDEIKNNEQHNKDSTGSGGAGMASMPSPEQIIQSGSMSPTVTNVYSWVFKPGDGDKDSDGKQKEFKLKLKPDSPFDISSTHKDFEKVAEILMLECNNPKNLFKVLKGVCAKLKLANPKYRRIDTMNSAVQNKLLRFEGAEEFLQLLGFTQNNLSNPTFWCCDMDQPPLSVLESAIGVCNNCLLECNKHRATMDMLKKFSTHDLRNHKKRKKKRSSRKHGKHKSKSKTVLKNNDKSMDTLAEHTEVEDMKKTCEVIVDIRHRNGSVNVDGTVVIEKEREPRKREPQPPMASVSKKPSNIVVTNHLSPQDHNNPDIDGTDDSIVDTTESPGSISSNNTYNNMQLPQMNLRAQASIRIDDATETLSNLDDIKFELELEGGDEDRFQLSDIVWSVTHKDNTDKEARGIILLCFPTFSSSERLIKCLVERFFEPEGGKEYDDSSRGISRESSVSFTPERDNMAHEDSESTTAHSPKSTTVSTTAKFDFLSSSNSANGMILSLWEVQVKVISFLQQWMRRYWQEDWDGNDKMLDIVENFCNQIENCYKNDPNLSEKDVKKGMKLIKMIHETMDFQEASLRSKKKKHASLMKQISIPRKFDRMTEMGSVVKKMRYDFVKLDNKRLGEQITLLDFKYFQAIKKRECLGQHWKKRNKYEVAPNICALIDQFNKMSKWVQATILLAKNVKTRGRLIKKFIKISNHLLALRNFQSLCAFHGALSSVPIHKLKHAWAYVPAKHIARFEEMRVIFNTRNNMGNLRKLHREAHAPLVPYTGTFLSDLVSIEEGNKKHKDDGTVNFAKLMRLSNAIDNILLYQRTQYEIQDDIAVQSLLLEDFKINAKLDADYIYKFSTDVAKKDQPKKQKSVLNLGIFGK